MSYFPTEAELLNIENVAEAQTLFASWLAACKQLPGGSLSTTHYISAGCITPTSSLIRLRTEGGAASDYIANIFTSGLPSGSTIILYSPASGEEIELRHGQLGDGDIYLARSQNKVIYGGPGRQGVMLHLIGTSWYEIDIFGLNLLSAKPNALIGYTDGAGGTVTQASSRTTSVVLNKPTGTITLFSEAGSSTWKKFIFLNTCIQSNRFVPVFSQRTGSNIYQVAVTAVGSGTCEVAVKSDYGTAVESPSFNFTILSGASA